jgi:hypothetical protein
MTEAKWLRKPDLYALEKFIRKAGNRRRLRLVACACIRADWEIAPVGARKAIQAGEALADGELARDALAIAEEEAVRDFMDLSLPSDGREIARRAIWLVNQNARMALDQVLWEGIASAADGGNEVRKRRATMILDIFGNPFRLVIVDPSWRTSNVVTLAEAIYQDRSFDGMPILADALMDAGCNNDDILNHCRQPSEHVRGCWVLDLLTGRK